MYSTSGDGAVSWQDALDFVAGINDGTYPNCGGGGYDDWRLPNVWKLFSLIDYGKFFPAQPSGAPFGRVENLYRSSTTAPNNFAESMAVAMLNGQVLTYSAISKKNPAILLYVRPVRGGK